MDADELTEAHATIESSGVDWMTATAYRSDAHRDFYDSACELLERVVELGNDVSSWRANGYHGRRAGGVAVGVRHDTWIARLSSDDARESWRKLYPLASNVSRLDVQTTFRLKDRDADFFARQRGRALASRSKRGRRSNVTLISSSLDGDSLYLGKRTSDLYARCYDKGREERSTEAGWLIRQELEYKRDRATDAAAQLYRASSEATESHQLVSSYFKSYRVQVMQAEAEARVGARGRATSDDLRCGWLERSVRPSIITLLNHGKLEQVLRALGLDEVVRPIADDDAQQSTKEA